MSFAKVLVPVTGSKSDQNVLETAFAAAAPFNAHVRVMFSHRDLRLALPYIGAPLSPDIVQELVDTEDALSKNSATKARITLAEVAEKNGVRIIATPEIGDTVTASYEERVGGYAACLEEAARLSDLIVLPPLVDKTDPSQHEAFLHTLVKIERPILLAGVQPPEHIGQKVAVGWDGGASAAHAISAAMPYLRQARAVEILSIQSAEPNERAFEGLKEYLTLHSVVWTQRVLMRGKGTIAEALLHAAVDDGCDLLVIGGYGHSRLYETILGGVTVDVMSHPVLPVMLVH